MGRVLQRIVDLQLGWGSSLGGALQPPFAALFHRATRLRDLLNGTWLGHPLHPAVTDLPVGALVVTLILDLANQRVASDVALVIVLLGMAAAALTGLADYSDTYGEPRDVGTVHAMTMVVALVVLLVSLGIRATGPADRLVPVILDAIGLGLVAFGAYMGGDLVFRLGNVVERHAWDEPAKGWLRLDVTAIPDGTPVRALAGETPLVVVRQAGTLFALHEVCSHAGGPLAEGRLVDGCIECPWHGSQFRLDDGRVHKGPATFDQPRFEIREAAGGGFEARRIE